MSTPRHQARAGEEQLVAEYRPLALAIAKQFFVPGLDKQDVRQEALVGLLIAARQYDGRSSSFRAFAAMVVRRWLITQLKTARREKRRSLNEAAYMAENEDGELVPIVDLLPGGRDPVDVLHAREQFEAFMAGWSTLSPLERRGLLHIVNGEPYHSAGTRQKNIE